MRAKLSIAQCCLSGAEYIFDQFQVSTIKVLLNSVLRAVPSVYSFPLTYTALDVICAGTFTLVLCEEPKQGQSMFSHLNSS